MPASVASRQSERHMTFPSKTRTYSNTSSASSSSAGSRADDLYDSLVLEVSRLRCHGPPQPGTTIDVWSAGNLRVNGHDQSLPTDEALELIAALRADQRVS